MGEANCSDNLSRMFSIEKSNDAKASDTAEMTDNIFDKMHSSLNRQAPLSVASSHGSKGSSVAVSAGPSRCKEGDDCHADKASGLPSSSEDAEPSCSPCVCESPSRRSTSGCSAQTLQPDRYDIGTPGGHQRDDAPEALDGSGQRRHHVCGRGSCTEWYCLSPAASQADAPGEDGEFCGHGTPELSRVVGDHEPGPLRAGAEGVASTRCKGSTPSARRGRRGRRLTDSLGQRLFPGGQQCKQRREASRLRHAPTSSVRQVRQPQTAEVPQSPEGLEETYTSTEPQPAFVANLGDDHLGVLQSWGVADGPLHFLHGGGILPAVIASHDSPWGHAAACSWCDFEVDRTSLSGEPPRAVEGARDERFGRVVLSLSTLVHSDFGDHSPRTSEQPPVPILLRELLFGVEEHHEADADRGGAISSEAQRPVDRRCSSIENTTGAKRPRQMGGREVGPSLREEGKAGCKLQQDAGGLANPCPRVRKTTRGDPDVLALPRTLA